MCAHICLQFPLTENIAVARSWATDGVYLFDSTISSALYTVAP